MRARAAGIFSLMALAPAAWPEQGVLPVHVADPQGRATPNVVLATHGSGSVSPPTDVSGRTRLQLAPDTRPGTELALQVVRGPQDFVFLSPWNNRVSVPPFENASQNVVEVILVRRGDRAVLESGAALRALIQKINAANQPSSAHDRPSQAQRDAVLKEIGDQYGIEPGNLDFALRDWGSRSRDPFEKGLAALYAEDYPRAVAALTESLKIRMEQLEKDQAAVADAATFLGQSQYEQGNYAASVASYEQAATFRPDDGDLLNNLGLSISQMGDRVRAESLFRRALLVNERSYGSTDPRIVATLNNLSNVLLAQKHPEEAESLVQRGLEIRRAKLAPDDPRLANSFSNAGAIQLARNQCAAAEPPLIEAERIFRRNPRRPSGSASNIAAIARPRPMEQRAIIINSEFASGQPGLASVLLNRASARACLHDLPTAERLAREAVQIERVNFGSAHPETAMGLVLLADILGQQQKTDEANRNLKEALGIRERSLGPNHPATMELRARLALQ